MNRDFCVQSDFTKEIEDNLDLFRWVKDTSPFKNAEYPLLSHTFRSLKNLAIFSLAQRKRYVYEKREALAKFLPDLPLSDIEILIKANRIFERNLNCGELPKEVLDPFEMKNLFRRIEAALSMGGANGVNKVY